MNCPNCKAKLSCGCQQRVATDKTPVCDKCLTAYELKLKKEGNKPTSAPSNVKILYTNPSVVKESNK